MILSSMHALADDAPASQTPGSSPETTPKTNAPIAQASDQSAADKRIAEQAAAEYQRALASYAKGDLPAALAGMRESYRLSKRPELLYNLARLYDELAACQEALENYRQYLELVPLGNYRVEAERARSALELRCPPPAVGPALATPVVAPVESSRVREASNQPSALQATGYWTAPRVLGWSAIATGALASLGAVYFTVEAVRARNEFQTSVDDNLRGGPNFDVTIRDRQHRDQTIARVLAVAGGAFVAGGALTLLLAPRSAAPGPASARILVEPGFVGASYSSRF